MRIVDRKTFISLPKGTLFCKFENGASPEFGDLMIKGDSIGEETKEQTAGFFYQDLSGSYDPVVNDDYYETLVTMMKTGMDVPMNFDAGSRDGFYDKEQHFAVFSLNDQLQLKDRLERAILDVIHANQEKDGA